MLFTPLSKSAAFGVPDYAGHLAADTLQLLSLLRAMHVHVSQDLAYLLDVLDATRVFVSEVAQNKYVEAVDPSGKVRQRLHACGEAANLLCKVNRSSIEDKQVEASRSSPMVLVVVAIGQACESLRTAIDHHDRLFEAAAYS